MEPELFVKRGVEDADPENEGQGSFDVVDEIGVELAPFFEEAREEEDLVGVGKK